ncbi:hypothetical protein [Nitrosophilus alvini]|uniref:hypothetical protein n=1 Tax=Nitrosophilus alvini TaxID=2714855 RepID=UPI00190C2DC0|nr:hypothetical protein [Nitrosophilus alvini]
MFTGLSLDQAPPFEAPLRFFLTAPIFGILAAAFMFFSDASSFANRYSPEMIATLHLITLGFMTMVMIGAMQQMLPVLVGVRFPKPLLFAKIIHTALVLGTLLMGIGLYFSFSKLLMAASLFLLFSIGIFAIVTGYKVFRSSYSNHTVFSMRFSIISLFIALLLGVHMLVSLGLSKTGESFLTFVDIHALWAFFGWTGLLIIGVSYQVVPMFYVTPDFSNSIKKLLAPFIFLFLFLTSATLFIDFSYVFGAVLFCFLFFGIATFKLIEKRKRKLIDTTINYWRISSLLLSLGGALFILYLFIPNDSLLWIASVTLLYGFAVSLINGMLYKIIPFLAWFHLSSMGYFDIPTMREMIPEKSAKLQMILHILAYLSLLLLPFAPLTKLSALLIAISNIMLFINLYKAVKVFFEYKKKPSPMGI